MIESFIALFLGWIVSLIIDFTVVSKGTQYLDFKKTVDFYAQKNGGYLTLSLISFCIICYFYFNGQITLPKDFSIDLYFIKIAGLRTCEFIVGFVSSYLFVILRKLKKPLQIETNDTH